jgi:hypothetical protein
LALVKDAGEPEDHGLQKAIIKCFQGKDFSHLTDEMLVLKDLSQKCTALRSST